MNDKTQAEEAVIRAPSRPHDVLPDQLYILPLPERPFFPAQAMPLMYSESPWVETFQQLYERNQQMVGLVLADIEPDQPIHADQLKTVGTVVRIHKVNREGATSSFWRKVCAASACSAGCRNNPLSWLVSNISTKPQVKPIARRIAPMRWRSSIPSRSWCLSIRCTQKRSSST